MQVSTSDLNETWHTTNMCAYIPDLGLAWKVGWVHG